MEVLVEAAKQIPSLVVLVWMVNSFITFIKSERESYRLIRDRELQSLDDITRAVRELQLDIAIMKRQGQNDGANTC